MSQISSNIPITDPPTWAVWERRLLKAMDQSVYPFLDHFTGDNDELYGKMNGAVVVPMISSSLFLTGLWFILWVEVSTFWSWLITTGKQR